MIKAKSLERYTNIIHGFSTIDDGDFSKKVKPSSILKLENKKIVFPLQIHGNSVKIIDGNALDVKNIDSLVTKKKNIILSVKTADCLPIIFFEPICNIIAIAHAGWKGTLLNINKFTIEAMEKLGAKKSRLIVAIGPHIMTYCYAIDRKLAKIIKNSYPQMTSILVKKSNKICLDLAKFNKWQLLKAGLDKKNIEIINQCTYCNKNSFFSYRRQGNISGRMINFICLTN